MRGQSDVIYTWTDEAPMLATHSLLPIIEGFTRAADVSLSTADISLAGRILAAFGLAEDDLAALGALTSSPRATIIKLPNISASLPQLKAAIAELQALGHEIPDYPDSPSSDAEREARARYDAVKGSAVNPVLREGNSDRRAPRAVKAYARSHPHSMGAWSPDSRTRVATMDGGDFRHNERSVVVPAAGTVQIRLVPADGGEPVVLRESLPVTAGEVVDATYMSAAALDAFLAAQVAAAMSEASPTELLTEPTPVRAAPTSPGHEPEASDDTLRRWRLETDLLLAERARATSATPTVRLPEHLAATRLDDLRADRHQFALDLRRPLPPEPRAAGRLGTVFHDAVALRLAARGQLLTLAQAGVPDTLDPAGRRTLERWLKTACELPLLQDHVLEDTEVELELALEPVTLRCRLDAVFRGPGGTWLIVDWKTGSRRVPVDQLSVYVHALAASRGVGTGAVRAAYVYVRLDGLVDELAAADLLSLAEIEAALQVRA